jgi:hypothetical protein
LCYSRGNSGEKAPWSAFSTAASVDTANGLKKRLGRQLLVNFHHIKAVGGNSTRNSTNTSNGASLDAFVIVRLLIAALGIPLIQWPHAMVAADNNPKKIVANAHFLLKK